MRRIKQLEGALFRKTSENEILKEAADFAEAKKWIARSLVLPGGEQREPLAMPLFNFDHLSELTFCTLNLFVSKFR